MNSAESTVGTSRPEAARYDGVIITMAVGTLLGLILIAQGRTTDKQFTQPMHSPNDRSRFATIRALGDNGTYAIGSINQDGSYTPGSILAEPGWDTIDKVLRPDDGKLYSSKPPLLPTLLAYEYQLIKQIPTLAYSHDEGWKRSGHLTFAEHPQAVVRIIVATANWVPFIVFLLLFSRLLDRLACDGWARASAMAAAGVGTYLTGFSVTLNNHTIAACASLFAIYPAFLIWCEDRREWWLFAVAGFFAAFTAVIELPAASLLAALFIGLCWKSPRWALLAFVPLAVIPVAGHFWTNYQALGSLAPAYDKPEWYDFPGSYWKVHPETGRLCGTKKDPDTGKLVIDLDGVDGQYEPWPVYLLHMLLGHHGIFSLSPIFLFSLVGVARTIASGRQRIQAFAVLCAGLTVVVLLFYLFFAGQRNYGGMCNGLRWLFWLIPLWLMFLPAGLEWKPSCRWFRLIALICLVISAASAFYATRNPWTRPWLHQLMNEAGWIKY